MKRVMKMNEVIWIYGEDEYRRMMDDITTSVKRRKDISREDYLALLRSRLEQWRIIRCVARLAQREFFHQFWGMTVLYPMDSPEDPIQLMAKRGNDSFGWNMEVWMTDAINVIEKGVATRQDMLRKDKKAIEAFETTIDRELLYFKGMREMCMAMCNVETLSDFEDLYQAFCNGYFGPQFTNIPGFGIAWYGPRDKYEQFRQRHGFLNADGELDTHFMYVKERLDADQKMAIQCLLREAREEARELKAAGKPRPDPWM